MPVLTTDRLQIDYTDDGEGEPVILIHSSAIGNQQWRRLIDDLQPRFRVLALNLFGYGKTTPWPMGQRQTLDDQAQLVMALGDVAGNGSLHIVGHSFGGAVAMKAGLKLNHRLASLVLLEPNPFYLLQQDGRTDGFREACSLRDYVKQHGGDGNWARVGERFADYWNSPGAWEAMSPERRDVFLEILPNNFHEWDGVMEDGTPVETYVTLAGRTLLVTARDTKRPIREIGEILIENLPELHHKEITEGGHMAPLFRPDILNPIVSKFLNR